MNIDEKCRDCSELLDRLRNATFALAKVRSHLDIARFAFNRAEVDRLTKQANAAESDREQARVALLQHTVIEHSTAQAAAAAV